MARSMALNLLNARQCELSKPGSVLSDGGGLYLEVSSAGKKHWRFRYTRPNSNRLPPNKQRNRLSLGEFPKPVSLHNARMFRDACRTELASGLDPAIKRRDDAVREAASKSNTLRAIAATWYEKQPWSDGHRVEWQRTLDRHVLNQVVERRALGSPSTSKFSSF